MIIHWPNPALKSMVFRFCRCAIKEAVSKVVSNTKDTKKLFFIINTLCSSCHSLWFVVFPFYQPLKQPPKKIKQHYFLTTTAVVTKIIYMGPPGIKPGGMCLFLF